MNHDIERRVAAAAANQYQWERAADYKQPRDWSKGDGAENGAHNLLMLEGFADADAWNCAPHFLQVYNTLCAHGQPVR